MPTEATSTSEPRVPLSRDRVLLSAVAIADRDGLESLTMRRLAESLGVEAMSLYYHVDNKDDILDGMVDIAFAEIDMPSDVPEWIDAMRRRANSVRDVLKRHPWAIKLMQSRTNPGPATLEHHDAVLGMLRTSGFGIEMTAHAISVMDAYIYGFVLQEMSLPFDTFEEVEEIAGAILEAFPTDAYPHLAELTVEHVLQPGYAYSNEFAFGLDMILDGLDQARATSSNESS